VECSINAIGMTDLEGKLIYFSESAVTLWGYDNKEEMLGRLLPELWEGERIGQTIEDLHCRGYSAIQDLAKRKDNSVIHVEYSANLIRDDDGEPLAMFGAFVDITKHKMAQPHVYSRFLHLHLKKCCFPQHLPDHLLKHN
jgi:PAS domain S-box-containing protein